MGFFLRLVFLLLITSLTGCSSTQYSWNAFEGHVRLLIQSKPIDNLLEKKNLDENLKHKLRLVRKVTDFASTKLHLPNNNSYERYTELNREAVVWNVLATEKFSLDLKEWCYLVIGCMSYRGYFSKSKAISYAKDLENKRNLEVVVVPIPAYSTLGWSKWLGGDPVLSTFISYDDISFMSLIFHELAHQKIFIKGDSAFNESFASTVEVLAVEEWLKVYGSKKIKAIHRNRIKEKYLFLSEIIKVRKKLEELFKQERKDENIEFKKNNLMQEFRDKLISIREDSTRQNVTTDANFIRWVNSLNNPLLAISGVYQDYVPLFKSYFKKNDGDWKLFYEEVELFSRQSKSERLKILQQFSEK